MWSSFLYNTIYKIYFKNFIQVFQVHLIGAILIYVNIDRFCTFSAPRTRIQGISRLLRLFSYVSVRVYARRGGGNGEEREIIGANSSARCGRDHAAD